MTKPLPFTENAIARAMAGVRKGGMKIGAVRVCTDGSVLVYDEKLVPVAVPIQDAVPEPSRWD